VDIESLCLEFVNMTKDSVPCAFVWEVEGNTFRCTSEKKHHFPANHKSIARKGQMPNFWPGLFCAVEVDDTKLISDTKNMLQELLQLPIVAAVFLERMCLHLASFPVLLDVHSEPPAEECLVCSSKEQSVSFTTCNHFYCQGCCEFISLWLLQQGRQQELSICCHCVAKKFIPGSPIWLSKSSPDSVAFIRRFLEPQGEDEASSQFTKAQFLLALRLAVEFDIRPAIKAFNVSIATTNFVRVLLWELLFEGDSKIK